MDGDATHTLFLLEIAFARVNASTHLDPDIEQGVTCERRALNGKSWQEKDREEAIPAAVDLDASQTCNLCPHDRALLTQKTVPRSITQTFGELR